MQNIGREPEVDMSLGIFKDVLEDNIKMDLKGICCGLH
jgi:hypothetical protein